MDEVKRTYRDVETNVKKGVRGIDGTDFKDHFGNAGDDHRPVRLACPYQEPGFLIVRSGL